MHGFGTRFRLVSFLLGFVLANFMVGQSAHAGLVVSSVAGTEFNIPSGLDTEVATGELMGPMSVTATFQGGATETATWMMTGMALDESGAATGSLFSLTQTGNTFSPTSATRGSRRC